LSCRPCRLDAAFSPVLHIYSASSCARTKMCYDHLVELVSQLQHPGRVLLCVGWVLAYKQIQGMRRLLAQDTYHLGHIDSHSSAETEPVGISTVLVPCPSIRFVINASISQCEDLSSSVTIGVCTAAVYSLPLQQNVFKQCPIWSELSSA